MSNEADARRLLGVGDDADAEAVRAARRRIAKLIHPDVEGGSAEAMRRLNDATATLLARLSGPVVADPEDASTTFRGRWQTPPVRGFRQHARGHMAHDVASFVIEVLPAEAFEALLVVTSWLGEVVVDEPPYQLDVVMLDPIRCWCRLDLVPDAGATTVSLTIASLPDEALPDIDDVRDLWVSSLNQLGSRPD